MCEMGIKREDIENALGKDEVGNFVDMLINVLAETETEGFGPMKILQARKNLAFKVEKIMDTVGGNMDSFTEDEEKSRRFVNFLEELTKLVDEFIKAEGI